MLSCKKSVWSYMTSTQWRGGATGKAFELAISRSRVQILLEATLRNNLRQVVHTYVPLSPSSITWYRRWCSAAGEVTAGLAESNGSLPPGGWLTITSRLTACAPRSAPGLTLGVEYGKRLPFFYSAVAEMGDCLAKIDTGRKLGVGSCSCDPYRGNWVPI